jgi:hypothetical protein
MPRARKPTNVLELKGAFKKDPQRAAARAGEPKADGSVGEPPMHLTPAARMVWVELTSMAHKGTLCAADRLFMEYAVKVVMTMRRRKASIDPKIGVRFEAVIARLGMSPADRSKVSVLPSKPDADPYAEFASG